MPPSRQPAGPRLEEAEQHELLKLGVDEVLEALHADERLLVHQPGKVEQRVLVLLLQFVL